MTVPDPYRVLQVDPGADIEVIRAAYKRLARRYHPDVSPDPASVERMVRINQAWEMLRDPVRRAAVDRARLRADGISARVVAADGQARASTRRRPESPSTRRSDGGWPTSSPHDMPNAGFGTAASTAAHGAGRTSDGPTGNAGDAARADGSRGPAGAAGPPPGSPSGSLVTFGRYQGWTLGEIARTDPGFLEWLERMPIGRQYHAEIDALLRQHGLRQAATAAEPSRRGPLRRR